MAYDIPGRSTEVLVLVLPRRFFAKKSGGLGPRFHNGTCRAAVLHAFTERHCGNHQVYGCFYISLIDTGFSCASNAHVSGIDATRAGFPDCLPASSPVPRYRHQKQSPAATRQD